MATRVGRLESEPGGNAQCLLVGMFGRKHRQGSAGMGELVPSHLASSSRAIGSSFGGSSWTGTLGANRSDIVVVIEKVVV